MSDDARRLAELVLTFCEGFMERGSGRAIYTKMNPAIGIRLREYVDDMAKAAKKVEDNDGKA